jgi:DNA invertase Pin-like site-specific DNA recombinase
LSGKGTKWQGENMAAKIIGYVRVSTSGQGASGLGIEAQQTAIVGFAGHKGAELIACYTEVESGRKSDRPQLAAALAHAKRSKATLVVAKLDRLGRNVAFLSALMEAKVDFVAVDNPAANKLTLHILAAVAEAEAEAISARTKAALAAYKARGGKLGTASNLTDEARQRGAVAAAEARRRKADEAYADLLPTVAKLRTDGLTQVQIADELNRLGHTTRRGKPWNQVQVRRVLQRIPQSTR